MTKKRKRSNKSKYKHESTGDYCTCAQYVAAIMCQRNAERKNQGSLPYKFWNKKPWDWTYKKQLFAANKVLKDPAITEEAMVKAIHSDEFKKIFSLNHPEAIGIIRKYQLLLDEQTEKKQEVKIKPNASHQKKKYGKKNIINTLRKLDDGKKSEEG